MSVTEQRTARRAPYAGLKVVELAADVAGEMTGLQFANMGADVVKVEPPGGAPSRHTGPWAGGERDPERSLAYWYYNTGKRSVVLDLAPGNDDRSRFEALVGDADLLISSLHPRTLRALALDLAALADAHPRLIVVSVTPFGLTGPWAEYLSSDLVGLAAGGLLITSGYDDHSIPPVRPGGDQAFHTTAAFAHIAATLALIERQRSGKGGLVDVAMHESVAVTVELANPYWFYPRAIVQRQTCRHAQPVPTQPALFQCMDGGYVYYALILSDLKPWQSLVEWMESYGLALDLVDAAYLDLKHRQDNFPYIQGLLESFFALMDSHVAYHEGQERGLPIGVLNAPEDLFEDEHLRARGFFQTVEQPGWGEITLPGVPYNLSEYASAPKAPAPSLGQHTAEVLSSLSPNLSPKGAA